MRSSSPTPIDEKLSLLLREILASGAPLHLKVISQSMSPLLQSGDTVIVKHAAPDEYHPGDIIIFEQDNAFTTHRLIAKRETHWLSKGDNALNPDPPLKPDQVLGKVSTIQKHGDCIQTPGATHFNAETHCTLQMCSHPWQRVNRALAKINLCQIHLIEIVNQITSRLFGKKQIRAFRFSIGFWPLLAD